MTVDIASTAKPAPRKPVAVDLAKDVAAELASNERTLLLNDYPQDRGIFRPGADKLNHIDYFGEYYLRFMQDLSEGDLIIHVGPGDFFAEMDYFSSLDFKTHANFLSVAYKLSGSPAAVKNLQFLEKFRIQNKFAFLDGMKFQDLRHTIRGKAKLVSDVFAAGSYDDDLFGFFAAASEILMPRGMLAVVLASVNFRSANGERISSTETYRSLKGYEFIYRTSYGGCIFLRTEEAFVAPKSELISFVARDADKKIDWPVRHYLLG